MMHKYPSKVMNYRVFAVEATEFKVRLRSGMKKGIYKNRGAWKGTSVIFKIM
jgi:hypothetical protein